MRILFRQSRAQANSLRYSCAKNCLVAYSNAMKKGLVVALIILCLWLAAPTSAARLACATPIQERPRPVLFFDVLDLPARIDEPKLNQQTNQSVLSCPLANRSG